MQVETVQKQSAFERFNNILRSMVESNASDLHISVGSGFRVRILGELVQSCDAGPLSSGEVASIAGGILLAGRKCTKDNLVQFVENLTDYDCSYSLAGVGRFRVNISSQRRSLALVLRETLEMRKLILPDNLKWNFSYIHADVGERGATREMVREVTGLIRGNGFEPMIKPFSFAASAIADKYT